MHLKHGFKRALARFGYELRRLPGGAPPLGQDPFADMRRLLENEARPLIFDVGANVGQSIEKFRRYFPHSVIHAFEPGADAFAELQRRTAAITDVRINRLALGASAGTRNFFVSSTGSQLNSLLEPSTEIWGGGGIKEKTQVAVSTVDAYCREHVEFINILKTDTQGSDFEVIRGAEQMLRARRVQLVYMEILFSDMYHGQARMDQIFGYLMDHGFELVTFYPFYYWGNKASWSEALFRQPRFRA